MGGRRSFIQTVGSLVSEFVFIDSVIGLAVQSVLSFKAGQDKISMTYICVWTLTTWDNVKEADTHTQLLAAREGCPLGAILVCD